MEQSDSISLGLKKLFFGKPILKVLVNKSQIIRLFQQHGSIFFNWIAIKEERHAKFLVMLSMKAICGDDEQKYVQLNLW